MAKRTAEIRWFFEAPPVACEAFLGKSIPSVERVDWYAFPCHRYSGIKFREGRLETKLLVHDYGRQQWGSVSGNVDSWTKWSAEYVGELPDSKTLNTAGWIAVHKSRHWRALAMGANLNERESLARDDVQWQDGRVANGCEVEWSMVTLENAKWWTVGFEAVGEVQDLMDNLRRAVVFVTGQADQSPFIAERSMAYPSWLWKVKTGGGMLPNNE